MNERAGRDENAGILWRASFAKHTRASFLRETHASELRFVRATHASARSASATHLSLARSLTPRLIRVARGVPSPPTASPRLDRRGLNLPRGRTPSPRACDSRTRSCVVRTRRSRPATPSPPPYARDAPPPPPPIRIPPIRIPPHFHRSRLRRRPSLRRRKRRARVLPGRSRDPNRDPNGPSAGRARTRAGPVDPHRVSPGRSVRAGRLRVRVHVASTWRPRGVDLVATECGALLRRSRLGRRWRYPGLRLA